MDVPSSVWILICWICWICSGECQYLLFSQKKLNWDDSRGSCKYSYNGYLADRDTIVTDVDIETLNKCTENNQFWLGNVVYRTQYIYHRGCCNGTDSSAFDGATYKEDNSLFTCHIHCYYEYGFALKGHFCKCLTSYDVGQFKSSSVSSCGFECLFDVYGFYGGNEVVSIYTRPDPSVDIKDGVDDGNCLYLDCNRAEFQSSPCSMQAGISVLCQNLQEKENVESWEMATDFCRQIGSYIVENEKMEQNCNNHKKFWSSIRRYEIDVTSKDNPTDGIVGSISCAFGSTNDIETTSWANCHEFRHFLCKTDDAEQLDQARCFINLTLLSPPEDGLQSGTDKTNMTVIGVVVGLLCCVAVGLAVFMILCIRRKRALAEHVQIKENKTYGKSIGYMRGKDLVFSQSTVTSVSSKQPKKDNGKSSNCSFHYDLAKPISDIVHIDSNQAQTSGPHYHSILMQEAIQYDVIMLEQEETNDGPYVTKVENDYDHLRKHREKTSGQLPEDEYSKCTENDYDYSMQRSEVSQTAQEDDDYSKCNASNTRSDEDYDHSVQRPETSRIDLDDHEYSKCNDVYTRTENDYDHSVQKSETSRVDIGDDNGYSKCNAAYCRTENDYDHSVQRPETSRSDIDDDNGYSKCNAAYTRTENEYDHSVQRSEASRVELDDENGYSHTTALPDNDVYDRSIRT